MKVIGITGGVGAGKSKVLDYLMEEFNAYVIKADELGHVIMKKHTEGYNEIIDAFGNEIIDDCNEIDRKKLGQVVFNDTTKLVTLEKIIHPRVKSIILNEINNHRKQGIHELLIIEAALLIQDGYKDICDEIWFVYVSKDNRVERITKSRGYTVDKCNEIINNQPNDDFYEKYTEFTIDNNLDFENTTKQINERLNIMI